MAYRERDRAAAIALALELMATGRVRGVQPDHDPAELDAILGPPTGQWAPPDTDLALIRYFGLLEVHCSRPSRQAPWRADFFSAQLWRMNKPLKWTVPGPELRRHGYEVIRREEPKLRADYYEVAESGSSAVVFRDRDLPRRWGHIAKISATNAAPVPTGTPDFNAVHRAVYAAIGRPRSTWADWLTDQGGPNPGWLRTAERTVYVVLRENASRAAEGVAFHAWLLDQAAAGRAWPADELAYRRAEFAAGHRDLPGVPEPETVAEQCLAALPMDRDAAARLPSDWRKIAPADVRASKMTRALLRCARAAEPRSPATLAELTRWQPLLPHLC
ncbi:hypothetical protein [Actinoplanes sp. NPDC051411]|uniref:hypothetical protein n=1 Tax=Actinoplanes sp. NPDC051411 TaxID=3155522 RepID=UPI003449F16F